MTDVRFAFRQILRSPRFAAVVVLSIALGVGANTAVFTWIENLLLRPLPGVVDQDRLVIITTRHGDKMWDTVSLPDLRDMAAMKDVFSGVCGSQQTPASLTVDRSSEWVYGQIVTASFFDVLGVKPILGRTFLPSEDEKPSGHPVLVISEGLWRRRFRADPGVIGRVVDLNRHAFTIVGVAPGKFLGDTTGLRCDFWAPAMMHHEVAYSGIDPEAILQRWARWHHTYGRLRPGVTLADARAALAALSLRLETDFPRTNRDIRFHAASLPNASYGAQAIFRPMLGLLLVVSLAVMLIVGANVANLLLARALARRGEVAIRMAVGASRTRILRQMLTESVLLATLGGAVGVVVAYWLVDVLAVFIPKTPLPVVLTHSVDLRVLAATVTLSIVAGLLIGALPAFQLSRSTLNEALKESGRTGGVGASHRRARGALVVIEVALALVLLIGAALCYRGLEQTRHVDIGLRPSGVLLAGLRPGMNGYTRETTPALYRTLRQRLATLPGVESVAFANWFPLGFEDTGTSRVEIVGQPQKIGQPLNFREAFVTPGYFETLGIPLVAGRDFRDDDDLKARLVAIVNETMAARFWPGQDAIGRTFKVDGREVAIIGVAKAGKYRALSDPPESFLYLPSAQAPWASDLSLCIRCASVDPSAWVQAIRDEIHRTDPNLHIWTTLPLADYIEAATAPQRIAATLLAMLSGVALGLAAMGVYAVLAYSVTQRRHEIGIRVALGATPRHVLWTVSRHGLLLTAIGIGVGLAGCAWATKLLAAFLFGVSRFDAPTFAAAPLLLGLIAALACYVPARRATRVNPVETLRAE